ncbi:helix-turn-helix domain-containing protein [Occultella aeris]|uniref:Helix-turn-helix domain protein n=2 Tax=Occultella aeris TaxID=2761496 RepID=A0A7M4DKR7_9MICO|nr:Helix-turn-helix domain protein [Occultella aeris]
MGVQMSTYLTIRQTAEALSCSTDTIRRMIARGDLKGRRFGRLIRIEASDLARAGKPVSPLTREANYGARA